ncbi:hypothetical protein [Streptomyces sp. NBC_00649]|uniref:hypothetical protein n=1 Tax=Streptomyces sp. NBC_00649 TaxID=2975798 RepID=UPI00325612C9
MTERPGDHLRRTRPAWELLEDKILIHTRGKNQEAISLPTLKNHDGIVLCGADAAAAAKGFKYTADGKPLLIDQQAYEHEATAEEPFYPTPGLNADLLPLFESGLLEQQHAGQLHNGATAALTPTGYLKAGDRSAVRAATERARDLDPSTTIFLVPLDGQWLKTVDAIDFLARTLESVPHLKAIALGADRNPLNTAIAAQNLRALVTRLHRVALIRTDLAGLEAFAHGAIFASIGMQTSLRHISRPGGQPPFSRGQYTTAVLHPDLMDYFKADKLATLYGRQDATCTCSVCNGRQLTRFDHTRDDQAEANLHNIAIWLPWVEELQRSAPGRERRNAWHEICRTAYDAYQEHREKLAAPGELKIPPWLTVWAGEAG